MSKYNVDEIDSVKARVEEDSQIVESIVAGVVKPYSKDLDKYVRFIKDCLQNGEKSPTDEELDDFCMNLSTYIYFAGGMVEQLGIRDDISKALYKEMYHSARSDSRGTVADKDSLAELQSQKEYLTNVCYHRAWQLMKSKVENAQELLSSIKKVLTRRMNEYQLTHMTN